MINTITEDQFIDEMIKHSFSYEGSKALFNYLEQLEEDCDIKIKFDAVTLRCDYVEYDNLKELLEAYDNLELESIEDFNEYTTVIEVEDTDKLIIQAF